MEDSTSLTAPASSHSLSSETDHSTPLLRSIVLPHELYVPLLNTPTSPQLRHTELANDTSSPLIRRLSSSNAVPSSNDLHGIEPIHLLAELYPCRSSRVGEQYQCEVTEWNHTTSNTTPDNQYQSPVDYTIIYSAQQSPLSIDQSYSQQLDHIFYIDLLYYHTLTNQTTSEPNIVQFIAAVHEHSYNLARVSELYIPPQFNQSLRRSNRPKHNTTDMIAANDDVAWSDFCSICGIGGELILCDYNLPQCNRSFHIECITQYMNVSDDDTLPFVCIAHQCIICHQPVNNILQQCRTCCRSYCNLHIPSIRSVNYNILKYQCNYCIEYTRHDKLTYKPRFLSALQKLLCGYNSLSHLIDYNALYEFFNTGSALHNLLDTDNVKIWIHAQKLINMIKALPDEQLNTNNNNIKRVKHSSTGTRFSNRNR